MAQRRTPEASSSYSQPETVRVRSFNEILEEYGGDYRSAQAVFEQQRRRAERESTVRYPNTPRNMSENDLR